MRGQSDEKCRPRRLSGGEPRLQWSFNADTVTLDFVHSVQKAEAMSSAYVSGRVPGRYARLVAKQARAAKTSKSDLVARYVIGVSAEVTR